MEGATYKASVNLGAQDQAGNPLDQNPSLSGSQRKDWTFKVRPYSMRHNDRTGMSYSHC